MRRYFLNSITNVYLYCSDRVAGSAANMGKVPVRLKEVVYSVSPFEVSILNGLFKDFPKKVHKNLSEVRCEIR